MAAISNRIHALHGTTMVVVMLLGALAPWSAQAAGRKDPGVITLATDVRSGPGVKDPVVATVPAGHRVTVLEMAGASARIQSAKVKGWVSASKVRIGDGSTASTSSSGGGNFFRNMTALLGGGGKTKDVKVTAGARGLTPGALEGANPDPAARQRMEALAVSRGDAQKFARRDRLVARSYEYLASGGGSGAGGVLQGLGSGGGAPPASASPDR